MGFTRACPHFGLVTAPSKPLPEPSPDHRCYLWQQQERVDLAHQQRYCLSELHGGCPWLMLPRPGSAPRRRSGARPGWLKAAAGGTVFAALIALLVAAPHFGFNPVRHVQLPAVAAFAPAGAAAPGAGQQGDPRLLAADDLSADRLTGNSLSYMTISIPTDGGGAFVAGNVGFSFPAGALADQKGPVSVAVKHRPASVPVPVAPWQISTRGTLFELMVTDADGKQITTFPAPVTMLIRYSDLDLGVADGDANILTPGFIIDSRSPNLANPVHFPLGTWVFFPPSVTKFDAGTKTVRVRTQVAPTVLGVMTRPYNEVQVTKQTGLYSSFAKAGKLFGLRGPASVLQVAGPPMLVAGPQIDSRLLILDPQTDNYAYVNVADVSPVLGADTSHPLKQS